MKNIFLKIALLLTLAALLVPIFASCGNSSGIADANGGWEGISWDYKKENKTLTIRGSETMPNAANENAVGWASVRTGVEHVIIVAELKNIGDYAFYGMYNLKTITIPKTVTTIGKYAFAYCPSLDKIELHDGITSIGESAFEVCSALKNITLPKNLKSLGARAFALCSALESVKFNGSGVSAGENGAEVVIPIGDYTFYHCKNLASVTVPTEFKSDFGDNAFKNAKMQEKDVKKVDPTAEQPETPTEQPSGSATEKPSDTATAAPTEKPTEKPTEPAQTEKPNEEGSNAKTIIALVILGVCVVGLCVGGVLLARSNKKQATKGATVRKNQNGSKKK